MIPKDYKEFAWWITEKLIDEAIIEPAIRYPDDDNWDDARLYNDDEIRYAIRRILRENDKEIK